MSEPRYLVQLLERNFHACKNHRVIRESQIPMWVEETQALIGVLKKRHPAHSYVMYISNNTIDVAKGESKLLVELATQKLRGESIKVGIMSSTKYAYLGMGRDITTFDFDNKDEPLTLKYSLRDYLHNCGLHGEYTKTENGIHVHIQSRYAKQFLNMIETTLFHKVLDKYGHDICSPIVGTYKGLYKITKGEF